MKKEAGFTLVEVIVSFIIITIILLSFYPLLNNVKKTTDSNTDRLVVVNLAEATLNRLKVNPFDYIIEPAENPHYLFNKSGSQQFSSNECNGDACDLFEQMLNEKKYFFEVTASQNKEEFENKLINIIITAKNEKGNIKYSVEGYVSYGN